MVFHQTLFNDIGNIHAILLSGKKTGYKIACALAMLVTSEHESPLPERKSSSRAPIPASKLFFAFAIDFHLSAQSTWCGYWGAPLPASSPSQFPIIPSVVPALLVLSVMLYKFLHKSQARLLLSLSLVVFQIGLLF